jgi:hypothetical protein
VEERKTMVRNKQMEDLTRGKVNPRESLCLKCEDSLSSFAEQRV